MSRILLDWALVNLCLGVVLAAAVLLVEVVRPRIQRRREVAQAIEELIRG